MQEDLARSLAEAAERRGMYAPDPDAAWIETHFEDLVPVHGGKYVVVHAGRIVDSCESYPDVARVVRAFTKGAPFICYVPKP